MFLEKLIEKRAEKISAKHPGDPGLVKMFRWFGNQSDAGVPVDAENAPETVAVMACIRVIAETQASCPLPLYERRQGDDREKARDHHLFELLRYQPNEWQTAFEFTEMKVAHVLLRGNFYAEKVFDNGGKIKALVPLHPDRVLPFKANGRRAYKYSGPNGENHVYLQDEIYHVPGLSFDGISGIDPIHYARNAIGLSRATEQFGSKFFANDATPGLVLKHPGPKGLSESAFENLKKSLEERHSGSGKAHRPMILEEGMEIDKLTIAPDNAQFLETRKFQKAEIAGFFRVPAHLINDLEKATFSNIESLGRQFIDYTMLPWFIRDEQAIRRDLLTAKEKKKYFAEYDASAFLRGDLQARYDAYTKGRNWGWLSANEIRRKENMNSIPGGDEYLQPLNMQPAGESEPAPKQETKQ